ncbi:YfiH family protein [Dyadobacter sp. BE34]|uniref:Purine nucleoside phosphorylase n=1 Tax=Dyadobacter fermentans TaxID=94254 RepID=A0ABU1QSP4_9BACT|nr:MULTISPECIES: peptidoglycan editing factor PgeF [Dyadobacter]MDR6803780.1 YfiH family protein [Dyadobacter fermentans]MDR7041520.1 YfiH family protein [Dyadobacter sp. BE242]MDR7195923.1 YfiH family protein [Dyadobacter sp. BE34]MDR7213532.1 YfiH family protein [Dyadobacter sp. BE31]MDR7261329.1 YfiH family protein [Dyadobacter sp. BE32]
MLASPTTDKQPIFRKPQIFSQFPELVAAESTRHGGVSTGHYASLNLGGSQDTPENIMQNNLIFFGALGIPFENVAKSHQVHGTDIVTVTSPARFEGFDALVTNIRGIQLAVTVADCTPILIYDPVTGAVAAIHAGWRGTVGGIVEKTVATMQGNYGTRPGDCFGYVGTCIDECSFEVGEDVAQHFTPTYKRWDEGAGKFFVDLKASNRDQLVRSGIKPEHVEISPYSTVLHNQDYFSHRAEKGLTGRLLVTIGRTS